MTEEPGKKLSDEDLARVAQYLNSPVHKRERAPFRPGMLLLVLMAAVTFLSALSVWYAWLHGVKVL
jgi:hypothetical protein